MLDSKDRVVMLSGASRGIGKAVADRLISADFKVSAGVRKPEDFSDTESIIYRRYEAEEPTTSQSWLDETLSHFGKLDALVNVAGIFRSFTLRDENEGPLDEMWRVNVKAPARLIRVTLPHLRECGAGRVINVVSVSGKALFSDQAGYAASKHAMMAITTAVRREAWKDGVRATAVCPGYVLTDMGGGASRVSQDDMTKPGDLAEVILTLLLLPNTAGVPEVVVDCIDQW